MLETIAVPPAFWTPSNTEYHADVGWWGSTMVKTFRESPRLAYRYYVERDLEHPPPSKPMVIGTLVHILIFEREQIDELVHVVDVQARNAKAYKMAVASHPGMEVVTAAEMEIAQRVAHELLHPQTYAAEVGLELLAGGRGPREYAHRWRDPSGVPCKVKFDRLRELEGRPALIDLKNVRDPQPEGYAAAFYNNGYDCQGAFYERGLLDLFGSDSDPLIYHVVARNREPHEVCVYEVSDLYLQVGRLQIESDLAALGRCLRSSEPRAWGTPAEHHGLTLLTPPTWVARKSDDNVLHQGDDND